MCAGGVEAADERLAFAVRFAGMEQRVGETARARAVFWHAAVAADVRRGGVFAEFWAAWQGFEVACGDRDTVREMLKRRARVALDHRDVVLPAPVSALPRMVSDGVEGGSGNASAGGGSNGSGDDAGDGAGSGIGGMQQGDAAAASGDKDDGGEVDGGDGGVTAE